MSVEGVVLLSPVVPELPTVPVAPPYFLEAFGGGKFLSFAVSPFTFCLGLSDGFGSAGLRGRPAGVGPRVCLPLSAEVNVPRSARRAREGRKHNGARRRVGEGCIEACVLGDEGSPSSKPKCCGLVRARASLTRACNVEPLYQVALETNMPFSSGFAGLACRWCTCTWMVGMCWCVCWCMWMAVLT